MHYATHVLLVGGLTNGNQWSMKLLYAKPRRNLKELPFCRYKKVKFSHTRYQMLSSELIPVYRQSARRWLEAIHPVVGCYYFPPGLRLPSQLNSVTAHRPVPNYTAWWQRHMRESSLPKAVTWKRTSRDSNPRPFGSRANALPLSYADIPSIMPTRLGHHYTGMCND